MRSGDTSRPYALSDAVKAHFPLTRNARELQFGYALIARLGTRTVRSPLGAFFESLNQRNDRGSSGAGICPLVSQNSIKH